MNRSLLSIVPAILALALAGCQTASISFPNAKIFAHDRKVESVSGLLSKPDGNGPFPAVVLLHSCGGFTSHVTRDWPDYFAGIGYVTLSVDTFGTRGYQRCPNPYQGADGAFVKDAYGALDYLATQPFIDRNKIAVMGFSLGAGVINNALIPLRARARRELDFKAAIALYGRCNNVGPYPKGSIPLMEIGAENDTATAPHCEYVGKWHPEIEVHILEGAYHAFDSSEASGKIDDAGNRMQYSWEATKKARDLVRAFLAKHLGARAGS